MGGSTRETVVLVIPASLSSRRLERKMLLDETGTPLIVHTWMQARKARAVDRVVIATGSEDLRDVATAAGAEVFMTPEDLPSGTDRVAAVAEEIDAPYFINLQGDEPTIDPDDIDRIAEALRSGPHDMVTLSQPIADDFEWSDPNTVKVVVDDDGVALYFSRAAIPHPKHGREGMTPAQLGRKHVGIYGFSRSRLLAFARTERTVLEEREGLEQLRALQKGISIRVIESSGNTVGINSREDYERFVSSYRTRPVENPTGADGRK